MMHRATRLALMSACMLASLVQAAEAVPEGLPKLDPSALPVANPYRGQATVLDIGQAAFVRYCQSCHGESARGSAEAPDLRRLNDFCRRLGDAELQRHCLADVDDYFVRSVRGGKVRAGLAYMPPWRDVLPPETIWAIRSYVETRPLPPLRTLPELPPGGAVTGVKPRQ